MKMNAAAVLVVMFWARLYWSQQENYVVVNTIVGTFKFVILFASDDWHTSSNEGNI